MKQHYEKSTQELMMDYFKEIGLQNGQVFNKKDMINWFNKNYPKIKNITIQCHLIKLSVNAPSRKHYNAHEDGRHDILYQLSGNTFRLYEKANDVVSTETTVLEKEIDEENGSQEFAQEKDLQNYLVKNLNTIEPGLKLYEDEIKQGIEYPVDGRFVDILALDKNNDFVVIELKVSKGYDRVVGQLLRYKNWIQKFMADEKQKVRGMIICKEMTDDLLLACYGLDDIELFEYEISFKLLKKEK